MNSFPYIEIHLNDIKNNYSMVQNLCPNSQVAAVVKANCYSLGANKIIPVLEEAGCKNFFVSCCDEGIEARNYTSQNIYILNGIFQDTAKQCIKYNLIPVINNLAQFNELSNVARNNNINMQFILHIDTGLNRLGISTTDGIEILKKQQDHQYLTLKYVMSHLASADNILDKSNSEQFTQFSKIAAHVTKSKLSFANSAGILLSQDYHYDLVRVGAALYGFSKCKIKFFNPIRVYAPIIDIKDIKQGEGVGYNHQYIANKKMQIAIIPIGYADGYLNSMKINNKVFIAGYEASILGKISMDLMTIDVTDIPKEYIYIGQNVELIGPNIRPDEITYNANIAGYEVLTTLGLRLKKIYK